MRTMIYRHVLRWIIQMMNIKEESAMSGWIRCPECGSRMCKDGDVRIDNNTDIPAVCQACGGPYPACSIGCDLLDDD